MPHRYSVRDIARQAGVSDATVDRVLHGRPGVRQSTAGQVRQAIRDLDAQAGQLEMAGRRFMIDVVTDAPARFNSDVRRALEAELPMLQPAVFRARFRMNEKWEAGEQAAELDRIARSGSSGVILKAPDVPDVAAAVGRLITAGIPVVTLVTDVPASQRTAYVGMDNRSAGATAAYLMTRWLGQRPGTVAVTVSGDFFRGEEEREMGFRSAMRSMDPPRPVAYLPGSDGLDATARQVMADALADDPGITAVYSSGGGNRGILAAFDEAGPGPLVFIGHDLYSDNVVLLRQRRIDAVLHHDFRQDQRRCCRIILQAHRAIPGVPSAVMSSIGIATPYNIPPGY